MLRHATLLKSSVRSTRVVSSTAQCILSLIYGAASHREETLRQHWHVIVPPPSDPPHARAQSFSTTFLFNGRPVQIYDRDDEAARNPPMAMGRHTPRCNAFPSSWTLHVRPNLQRRRWKHAEAQRAAGLGSAISFGASTERRLETLAVFTFSLYLLLPLIALCWSGAVFALLDARVLPVVLTYLVWVFLFDTSPTDGSRRAVLRGRGAAGNWWRRYCDYFPVTLVKTAALDPNGRYVVGFHPHGVISIGAFACFATNGARTLDLTLGEGTARLDRRGPLALFPGVEFKLLTLAMNFLVPFAREYILWLGCLNASKRTFRSALAAGPPGRALVIVPGGAAESMEVEPGAISLVLKNRKGFVREAVLARAALVPCLAFGETSLYNVYHPAPGSWLHWLQDGVYKRTHVGMPLFSGRSIFYKDAGLMPCRRPIVVVVGAPLAPPPPAGDLRGAVDALHAQYVAALQELYNRHKDAPWNVPSLQRTGSFRLVR